MPTDPNSNNFEIVNVHPPEITFATRFFPNYKTTNNWSVPKGMSGHGTILDVKRNIYRCIRQKYDLQRPFWTQVFKEAKQRFKCKFPLHLSDNLTSPIIYHKLQKGGFNSNIFLYHHSYSNIPIIKQTDTQTCLSHFLQRLDLEAFYKEPRDY